MAEALTTLPCGCFFQGRQMVTDPDCSVHDDSETEWECENCGETAMDGGDRCIACGTPILEACTGCDTCGELLPLDMLDAKPEINSKLRRIRAREGQLVMLRRAADLGFQFDRLECRACYGPGYRQL